ISTTSLEKVVTDVSRSLIGPPSGVGKAVKTRFEASPFTMEAARYPELFSRWLAIEAVRGRARYALDSTLRSGETNTSASPLEPRRLRRCDLAVFMAIPRFSAHCTELRRQIRHDVQIPAS